jgi:hypothetical protein
MVTAGRGMEAGVAQKRREEVLMGGLASDGVD